MKRYDTLTDINLKLLNESNGKKMYESEFINEQGKQIESWDLRTELLAEYMESKGFITLDVEMCYLTEFGEEIFKNKGWVNYLKKQSEKNKIENTKQIQKDVQDEIIRKETISEFEYKKYAFYMLIVGTLIALLSWITQGN